MLLTIIVTFVIIESLVNRIEGQSCPTGSPLPDIFCGRGPDRQDCPSGYYCEIEAGDRYAICCPVTYGK